MSIWTSTVMCVLLLQTGGPGEEPPPGRRAARALILLHELGHLIQDENGDWLIPDDGFDGRQSKANTLRVQQMCRKELDGLQ